ncbi:MAG TPA: helical backbone metal receptor [Gemmatimonadaceae bacterium]|nr:helical backbone metal receptor [Gemmatimonadaceae bacterium]
MPFLLKVRPLGFLLLLIAAACTRELPRRVPEADDFGDPVIVKSPPRRVVSLNPATTDLVFALGAGNRLVGRTHWDSYPDSAKYVPDLGSGIRPNVEAVLGARPDLVLLYASNDNRAAASELRAAGVNTLSLKIDHIADFHRAARTIAFLLGDSTRGAIVSDSVERTLRRVRDLTAKLPKPRVFWHIWDAPLITIGRGSYMNELVEIAGGVNVYSDFPEPSPTVSIEDVLKRDPDYIITGPEGSTEIRTDSRWAAFKAVKTGKIFVVDTAIVGRPSVRLGEAAMSLAKLFHPSEIR